MGDSYLKYDDYIFISSNAQPPKFLSGRSILEGKAYMLQLLDDQGSIINYDNYQECIFKLVPNLHYRSSKNQQNAKTEKKIKQEKKDILDSRVQNEKEQNQQIINNHKGKPIKIGDIVLIQHVISGCYIEFSIELNEDFIQKPLQNKNQQPIFNVILSENIDSRTLFKIKIDPQLAFKKDGEYLNKEDSFYFQSMKNQSTFCFETQIELQLDYQLNQQFDTNNYIAFPSIMERSMAFKIFQAVHVSQKGENIFSTFKIIYIENHDRTSKNHEDQDIFYGDFVRLTHLLKEKKIQSYLNSEINITGTCPQPLMVENQNNNSKFEEKESVCSIFQIIPENDHQLGSQLLFLKGIPPLHNQDHHKDPHSILLRHWLTGKYLNIHIESNQIAILSDSLDDFIYKNNLQKKKNEHNQTAIMKSDAILQKNQQKKRIKEMQEIKKGIIEDLKNQIQNSLNSNLPDKSQTQALSSQKISIVESNKEEAVEADQEQDKEQEQEQKKDGYSLAVLKFIQNNLLQLQSFQNDEKNVTNASKFYMENCYPDDDCVEHMEVLKKPVTSEDISIKFKKSNVGWVQDGVNYEGVYLNIANKKSMSYQLQSSSIETKDFFNFQVVDNQEIQFVSSVLSRMHPLIVLSCNPSIIKIYIETPILLRLKSKQNNDIQKCNQSLLKISHWLCDQNDAILFEQLITMKVNQDKQRIIRQVGLIDIVIKIFYHLKELNVLKDSINKNSNLSQLSIIIINFLRLATQNNYLNSFYVFQWYQMMKNILLNNDTLPPLLQIDKLLLELFNQTKLNQIYIERDDIQFIASQLEFKKLNKQALNLLLCFCNFNQESGVDIIQQEKIIQEVLEKNSQRLFKDFIYNEKSNKLTLQLDHQKIIEIDHNLITDNKGIYEYIQSTLQLICEISKGDENLVIKYIKQLSPFQTCISAFNNNTIPAKIRALFMNIFLESYIKFDSRCIQDMNYPYLIILHKDLKDEQKGLMYEQRKIFQQKYFYFNPIQNPRQDVTNLKDYIFQQLINLVNKDILNLKEEDNLNIASLFEINYYLLKKNLFSVAEMGKFHTLFDDLIKNTYTYLICRQKMQQSSDQLVFYDIQTSFDFINKILDCLYYIELQEQNEMLIQFFTLQQGEEVYSKNFEELLLSNKRIQYKEIKNIWQEQLEQRKEIILQFITCIETPNTEVIYYYFKLMEFNNNLITQSIIRLIFQIFNMRYNILNNFNNLIFINEKNFQIYDIFSENFNQLQIDLIDIQNILIEDQEYQKKIYTKIDKSLDNIAQNIFEDYIKQKNENNMYNYDIDIDEKQNSLHCLETQRNFLEVFQQQSNANSIQNLIFREQREQDFQESNIPMQLEKIESNNIMEDNNKKLYKGITSNLCSEQKIQDENLPQQQENRPQPKSNLMSKFTKQVNNIQVKNRLIKQCEHLVEKKGNHFFLWEILDNNKFDIRIAYQKQQMLIKIDGHKILMKLISYISKSNMDKNSQLKQSVLKTSFNILIFFCIKNQKNSNQLLLDKDCLQLIKDILKLQNNNIQIYVMMFIAELFKDNYQLLICLKQNQEELLQELSQIFLKIYEQNKNSTFEIFQIDYCIYYVQLLYFFFSVRGNILLQNQVWIFQQIKAKKFHQIFKDLLKYSKNVQVQLQNKNDAIQVPDKLVLFTCLLNLIGKLFVQDSKNKELIAESKKYISLVDIIQSLENMGDWYFLKQEIMSFLLKFYIKNNKLSKEEEIELQQLFKGPIYDEIIRFIEKSKIFQFQQKYFISNQKNILQIITSYSTKTHVINQNLNVCHDYYMLFGILDCILAYFDRFFTGKFKYSEQNNQFLIKYIASMEILYSLWYNEKDDNLQNNKNYRVKQIKKFLDESNSYLNKSVFLNTKDTIQSKSDFIIHTNDEKLKKNIEANLVKMKAALKNIYSSQRCLHLSRLNFKYKKDLMKIDKAWDTIQSMISDSVDQTRIYSELTYEMDMLIGLLVKMREKDVQSFKSVVKNMIDLLTDESLDYIIKDQCIKVLRHLANFNDHPEIAEEIRKDLCELGFTKFLCQVISKPSISQSSRYVYILSLVDFLDEGEEVQQSLYQFCSEDKENVFMNTIHNFILNNFQDFKEYEKGLQQRNKSGNLKQDKQFDQLREVIDNKIEYCNRAIWVLKMACEGHFSEMQAFVREQTNEQGRAFPHNINMVDFGADLFCQYIAVSDASNILFGEHILDFLIEIIQGPCYENQVFLSQGKILEVIEDLMLSLVPYNEKAMFTLKAQDVSIGSYTKKIYLFLLSMFEGSDDHELLETIQSYIDPIILFKRLMFIYKNVVSEEKSNIEKKLMKRLNGFINEEEKDLNQQELEDSDEEKKPKIEKKSKFGLKMLLGQVKILKQPEQYENDILEDNEDQLFVSNDEESKVYTQKDVEEEFGDKLDDLKEEANFIFILMRLLSFKNESFKSKLEKSKIEFKKNIDNNYLSLYKNTMMYYKKNIGRIEIINETGDVQILFFAKPDVSKYLSESTKETFLENVERTQPNDKIKGLLNSVNDFIDEMSHYKFIMTNIPVDLDFLFTLFRYIVLFCAFIINFMILFDEFDEQCIECDGEDPITHPCVCSESDTPTILGNGIQLFGLVIFGFNIFNFTLWAILKLKLDILNAFNSFENLMKEQKKKEQFEPKNPLLLTLPTEVIKMMELSKEYIEQYVYRYYYIFQYMAFNSYFLYLSGYAFITILGITSNRIFFTFLLLDIVERSLMLQNILKSVTNNSIQLIMMGVLGFAIMFIYAMLGFYSVTLHDSMSMLQQKAPICQTPLNCFIYVLNLGFRSGGGVGEPLLQPNPYTTDQFNLRFIYDLTFFIIVNVIWMNVIFGIIIDTFAQLREDKNKADLERKKNCFICSIENIQFEKNGIFFEQHTENEHNTWNYFLYIVHLKLKDSMDYTGTESFVFDKYDQDDISWFPIGKSLSLLEISDEEEGKDQFLQKISTISEGLQSILQFQEEESIQTAHLQSHHYQDDNHI